MNESNHPSPENLAAFVDGRLSGEERRGVVAHLDACPDCYEVFAETVRFQGEEQPRGQVLRPPRLAAKRWLGWAAAAAAVVAVAIALPILRMEPERPAHTARAGGELVLSSEALVAELAAGGEGTPAAGAWEGWPQGLGFAGDLDRERVSFRAGVWLMDLSLAARDGHAGAAEVALAGLADVLERAEATPELSKELEAARRHLEDRDFEALGNATAGLEAGAEELLEPDRLAIGKWAEAGRLAALAGNRSFFRSPAFAGFREELGARELSGPVRRALDRIDELTPAEAGPPEAMDELAAAFEVLVGVAG